MVGPASASSALGPAPPRQTKNLPGCYVSMAVHSPALTVYSVVGWKVAAGCLWTASYSALLAVNWAVN